MSKTGYYTHRACWKHEMGQGHPECPDRLDAIEDRLLISGVGDALERIEAPRATLGDIELAHDRLHIAAMRGLTDWLIDEQAAGGPAYMQMDTDTSINAHSFNAALHSAGAALAATDAVIKGELENAFCATRPPGHHATRTKAMGFCFFNNVAIAALHAVQRHGLERVAIIDFDVHHGNGTEDILAGDERFLMVSFFQHPLYPFNGHENPANNMFNIPVPAYSKNADIRDLVTQKWLPKLEEFKPQMLFISAGFDAHREDDMGQLGLMEQDYAWITAQLKAFAKQHCGGRIVSCLEGGYVMSPLARSVEAHVRVLADI